jgi:hypothetical protein
MHGNQDRSGLGVSEAADQLRDSLSHVYWLGGSPCSGKSTIADLIHNRYGLDVYHVDEAVRARFGPYDQETQPCMHRWTTSTWDDLWMRPVETLLMEVFQCYKEQFDLVLADLMASRTRSPVVVEGNPLLPAEVAPLLLDRSRALWLAPTEAFQRKAYPNRGPWVQSILGQCRDPEQALQNWMDRDVEFADLIAGETNRLGLRLIIVDGERSIEQNMRLVADHFGFECERRGS